MSRFKLFKGCFLSTVAAEEAARSSGLTSYLLVTSSPYSTDRGAIEERLYHTSFRFVGELNESSFVKPWDCRN